MLTHLRYSPLAAAILLAINTPAVADDEAATFSLGKVTVASTRTEQKQEDVANSVSVITEENIENNLSSNIRDLIRYEPGVAVGNGAGDAQRFGSKGFNIRGMDENRVKITVDGLSQANSFTPAGNPFQRASRDYIDIDMIKRVEIVKGPASTLYGSDALGGIVAFTTKDPADVLDEGDNTAGSIKLRYGSSNASLAETLTLANRTGALESLLIYTHRDFEEQENHDDSDFDLDEQDSNSDNILAKLQYQLNEAHRIGLTLEDFSEDRETDSESKLASSSYSDFYRGDDTTERQRVSFFHNWQANNALFDQLEWQLDWQDSEKDQETHTMYSSPFGPPTPPIYRIKDYSQQEETERLSAQFDKTVSNHSITYGFEYEETDLTNRQDTLYPTDTSRNDLDRAVPLVEGTSYGLYLQDQITLMDGKLLVTPGIRHDSFEAEPEIDSNYAPPAVIGDLPKHDSDKTTFRLGAVYKINDVTSVFAQYSQGFKAPDLIDLYYASERNYGPGFHFLTLPNPELEPEESDSYEIGFRLNGDLGELEVVAFYNEYDNFIEERTVGNTVNGIIFDRVIQSQNIESATIKGAELRAAAWLDQLIGAPAGSSLQVAIAYADGEDDETDTPLETIQPMKAVIGLGYDAPSDVWGGMLNWTLVESKDESDLADETDFSTPGYGTLDLTTYYNINQSLVIHAGIFNITDKEFWEYEDVRGLSADSDQLGRYTQSGRNYSLSVKYSF